MHRILKTKKWLPKAIIISIFFGIVPFHALAFVPVPVVSTFLEKFNTGLIQDEKENILKERAKMIDDYFASKDMPLSGFGYKMVLEADRYGLDWRLLPAIATIESTGGKFACKRAENNPFGYGSCKINFESIDHAIEKVAQTLAGESKGTAHLYKDKNTEEKLKVYNPPSVVPKYAKKVFYVMNQIASDDSQAEIL